MRQESGAIPHNHVIGVLKSRDEDAIRRDLNAAGYADVLFLTQREVEEKVDPEAENANPLVRLIYQLANQLSEQASYLEQYEEAARKGNHVVAVRVDDDDGAQQVKEILLDHDVVDLRYFGRLAVKDLTPDTNPSATSDRLP